MKRFRFGTRGLATGIAAVAVLATAGGVAYATIPGPGNVYTACMLRGVGTIRLIDKSLPPTNLMSHCTDKETEISWNQAGQPGPAGPQGAKGDPGAPGTNGTNGTNGKDGVNVTSTSEPAGANCADGGVQLTAANGVSYVCNGAKGDKGDKGDPGSAAGGPDLAAVATLRWQCCAYGDFPVGSSPVAVAFDGSSIWVANSGRGTVSKLTG
jgi:hypothetical protein